MRLYVYGLVADFVSTGYVTVEAGGLSKQLGVVSRALRMGELARICCSMLSSKRLNCACKACWKVA